MSEWHIKCVIVYSDEVIYENTAPVTHVLATPRTQQYCHIRDMQFRYLEETSVLGARMASFDRLTIFCICSCVKKYVLKAFYLDLVMGILAILRCVLSLSMNDFLSYQFIQHGDHMHYVAACSPRWPNEVAHLRTIDVQEVGQTPLVSQLLLQRDCFSYAPHSLRCLAAFFAVPIASFAICSYRHGSDKLSESHRKSWELGYQSQYGAHSPS